MSMHDPERHERMLFLASSGYVTIEIGKQSTKTGVCVQLDTTSLPTFRTIIYDAFDVAGRMDNRQVGVPGWWAAVICAAAVQRGLSPIIQRAFSPGEQHFVLLVKPSRMIEAYPEWPLLRMKPYGKWLDMRGEHALAHGPSDAELLEYAEREKVPATAAELRSMFDAGVLEWDSRSGGYRGVRSCADVRGI